MYASCILYVGKIPTKQNFSAEIRHKKSTPLTACFFDFKLNYYSAGGTIGVASVLSRPDCSKRRDRRS